MSNTIGISLVRNQLISARNEHQRLLETLSGISTNLILAHDHLASLEQIVTNEPNKKIFQIGIHTILISSIKTLKRYKLDVENQIQEVLEKINSLELQLQQLAV